MSAYIASPSFLPVQEVRELVSGVLQESLSVKVIDAVLTQIHSRYITHTVHLVQEIVQVVVKCNRGPKNIGQIFQDNELFFISITSKGYEELN